MFSRKYALLTVLLFLTSFFVQAQNCPNGLSGNYSVGPSGNFPSITRAIDTLKLKGVNGPVILELQAAYNSIVETFPLVFKKIPCADSSRSIIIRPQAGAVGLQITSNDALSTIDFNNGSFISVDGRSGGAGTAKNLEIHNTNKTGNAVRFINGVSSNSLRHLTITGVNNSSFNAVVYIAGSDSAKGNSRLRIDTCNISGGATAAANIIFAQGTIFKNNDSLVIDGCNIFDFYFNSTGLSGIFYSNGIFINSNNSNVQVLNNHIYQTAARSFAISSLTNVSCIRVNTVGQGGHRIANNFVGGSGPGASGSRMSLTGAFNFKGITVYNAQGDSNKCRVFNNTVTNLYLESKDVVNEWISLIQLGKSLYTTLTPGPSFHGECSGNTIGSGLSDSAIIYKSSLTQGVRMTFIGLEAGQLSMVDSITIHKNIIGGLYIHPASIQNVHLIGMWVSPTSPFGKLRCLIDSNLIGSTISKKSIWNRSGYSVSGMFVREAAYNSNLIIKNNTISGLVQETGSVNGFGSVVGIELSGSFSGLVRIEKNKIQHLRQEFIQYPGDINSVLGISTFLAGNISTQHIISDNEIQNLYTDNLRSPGSRLNLSGIFIQTNSATNYTCTVKSNFIHSLSAKSNISSGFATSVMGVYLYHEGNNANIENNMIRLGMDTAGNALNDNVEYIGVREDAGLINKYIHNTIYIGGKASVPSASYAFYSEAIPSTKRYIYNNILVNNRVNISDNSKPHSCYGFYPRLPGTQDLNMNHNDYYFSPQNGFFGNWIPSGPITDLASWRAVTSKDTNSVAGMPNFKPTIGYPNLVDLHIQSPTIIEGRGTALVTTSLDFDGDQRSALSPVDIGADAGSFLAIEPSSAAAGIQFSAITANSATVSLTPGDGSNRLFVIRKDNAIANSPIDGQGYAPNANFGSGANIGLNSYVVADTGSTITINGLASGTTYHVSVFEYNGRTTSANYLLNAVPNSSFITSGVTGLIDLSSPDFKAKIFPNPGNRFWLTMNSLKAATVQVTVYSISGQQLFAFTWPVRYGNNQIELKQLNAYPGNNYILSLAVDNKSGSVLLLKK